MPGFGRTQRLVAHDTRDHRQACCDGCGAALTAADARADNGFQSVDLVWGDLDRSGLHLQVTDHRLFETTCACGHRTHACPGTHQVKEHMAGAGNLLDIDRPGIVGAFYVLEYLRCEA